MNLIKNCPKCNKPLFKVEGEKISFAGDRIARVEYCKGRLETLCDSCKSWITVESNGTAVFDNKRTSKEILNGFYVLKKPKNY